MQAEKLLFKNPTYTTCVHHFKRRKVNRVRQKIFTLSFFALKHMAFEFINHYNWRCLSCAPFRVEFLFFSQCWFCSGVSLFPYELIGGGNRWENWESNSRHRICSLYFYLHHLRQLISTNSFCRWNYGGTIELYIFNNFFVWFNLNEINSVPLDVCSFLWIMILLFFHVTNVLFLRWDRIAKKIFELWIIEKPV